MRDFGFLCNADRRKCGSKTGSSCSKWNSSKVSAAVSTAGHLKFPTSEPLAITERKNPAPWCEVSLGLWAILDSNQ